jgi:hypothetical protein
MDTALPRSDEAAMNVVARRLSDIIETARPRLLRMVEEDVSAKPYADKWSLKEILGHLVDSASNNHQRVVRMQEAADIGQFRYAQEHWVNSQQYRSERWDDLVNLWFLYNKHFAHVIQHIEASSLTHVCHTGGPEPVTLQFVVEDYVRHVRHHLDQIFSDADPRERKKWKPGAKE